MIAHLVGNGPSKKNFVNNPEGKIFGCNFSSDELDLEATFIHDSRVFEHILNHKVKLKWPVINKDIHLRKYGNCSGLITILDTYYPPNGESTVSSGHMGLIWLASKGYREIHMWGFNSLLDNDVSSDSKGKIDGSCPNPLMLPSWKNKFKEIFKEFKRLGIKCFLHKSETEYENMT